MMTRSIRSNRAFCLALMLMTLLSGAGVARADSVRPVSIDGGWKFIQSDPADAQSPDLNDSAWRSVELPHDWSIAGPISADNPMGRSGGYFPAGIGWYRRIVQVPAEWIGKNVSVEFEGVYMNADVYLNGKHLASHPYGYTSFHVDLSPALKEGANLLAVRVDNSQHLNSRWYSGSGIYRHVWLHVSEPVHFAPYGLAFTTEELDDTSAKVKFAATVVNDTDTTRTVALEATLLNPSGAKAGQAEASGTIGAGASRDLTGEMTVDDPQAWSLEDPELYRLNVALTGADRPETISTECGIRTIAYSADKGFQLNGKTILMNGGCVHHDNGCLGAAAYDRAEIRRVELMKAAGFNAIRTAHNPPSPEFLRACDRLGMLVMDESFDCWQQGKNPHDYGQYFNEWWKRDIDSMVMRDRNHPSVVMWSIGNEIPNVRTPEGLETGKMLADEIRRIDPTRPVTTAVAEWALSKWQDAYPVFAYCDVAGYNYKEGQYQPDHQLFPKMIAVGSETFPRVAFEDWAAAEDHPYQIGAFIWTAMDYLGESALGRISYSAPGQRRGGPPNASVFPTHGATSGDIDLIGQRRALSHYRNILWQRGEKLYATVEVPVPEGRRVRTDGWSQLPTVQSWTWPEMEGKPLQVEVFSRYAKVRLYLNDKLIGEKPTTRAEQFKASFPVPYAPGTLKAVGIGEGGNEEETFKLETAGPTAKLRLSPDRSEINATGGDLSFVTVEAVDDQGRVQPNDSRLVKFEISGPGEIVGVDNADLDSVEPYQASQRTLYGARALVVVRPTGKPGETIHLTAKAEGLPDASVELTIVENLPMTLNVR